MSRTRTLTAGQGRQPGFRESLITGFLLRLARQSAAGGCSQERLARTLGVSLDTVAGWETGRRPLAAVRTAQFTRLRSEAAHLGADPRLVRLLGVALEADQILDHARTVRHEPGDFHPLGAHVHRREVVELAAWPLSGRTPAQLPAPAAGRGPAVPMPEVSRTEQAVVFDHLRRAAETAGGDVLLRRQALYLQSYDRREDAASWMADQNRQMPRSHAGWTPQWPVARTLAAALVRYGDPTELIDFAEYGLADQAGHIANLNYWAYWVGETQTVERDDSFMAAGIGPWRGDAVMRHLAARLDAPEGVADLGAVTLSTLIAARPRLLDEDPALTASLAVTAGRLLDSGKMASTARRALDQVCYALRLHGK